MFASWGPASPQALKAWTGKVVGEVVDRSLEAARRNREQAAAESARQEAQKAQAEARAEENRRRREEVEAADARALLLRQEAQAAREERRAWLASAGSVDVLA